MTKKPKVYVTRRITQQALDMIREATEMRLWEGELPVPREVLLKEVKDVEGLLSMLTERIDSELFDAAPKLKVASNMAVGFDNVDLEDATRRGIPVGNTPGVLTETTADFAFALFMAAGRRVTEGERYIRAGQWKTWSPMMLLGQDLHHATLGIVGLGRVGWEVAKRARGFDMKVIYYDEIRRKDMEEQYSIEYAGDLLTLLSRADFVTVHVNLTPKTRHLMGAKEFAAMKPTAIFVNTSRGPVVDQKALYHALKDKTILAAGIDVTEVEPIPMDDPLLTLDNLTITPHIASASVATRTKMALLAVENLLAGLRGEIPSHCPNAEALKSKR